jgi:hypothetical protein
LACAVARCPWPLRAAGRRDGHREGTARVPRHRHGQRLGQVGGVRRWVLEMGLDIGRQRAHSGGRKNVYAGRLSESAS